MGRKSLLRFLAAAPVLAGAVTASAQFQVPQPAPQDGATLFRNQCATCHTLDPADPVRQGPPLAHVIGRPAGGVPGFHYSSGFASADFTWDPARLDAWLTNPQAIIPGAVMAYRQSDPEIRRKVIAWLKEQN